MSITLKQIGQEAGVSESLVSYALNGNPRVSEETRQRVIQIARDLGYSAQSNRGARTLAARRHGTKARTGILALLMPSPVGPFAELRNNPFFLPYLNGVEVEASLRDYDLFLCSLREDGLPRLVQNSGVDGVIGVSVPESFEALRTLGIPALALGVQEPGNRSLIPDDAHGIQQALVHLVQAGHRRIAYLGIEPGFSTAHNRLQAYRESLEGHGILPDDSLIEATLFQVERSSGASALDTLAERADFTALICYNDVLAMGAIDRLAQLGRRVPEDVAVIGFDDYATEIGFRPHVSSVAFDRHQMGRRAVEVLCEHLDGPVDCLLPPDVELFPTKFIARETA